MMLSASSHGCFDSSDLEQLVPARGFTLDDPRTISATAAQNEVGDLPVRFSVHKLERESIQVMEFL